jgi:DNA-binding NarL/FixJ family response regulator
MQRQHHSGNLGAHDSEGQHDWVFTEHEWSRLIEPLTDLSPRQEQIAKGISRGLSDKQIAERLDLAVPTVRTHMTKLYAKLGVADRVELLLALFRAWRDVVGNDGHG